MQTDRGLGPFYDRDVSVVGIQSTLPFTLVPQFAISLITYRMVEDSISPI